MITINTYYNDYAKLKKFTIDNHDLLFNDGSRSVLVQVFCGIYDKKFLTSLLQQVCELVPHAQIIGTTTSGEIMNGEVSGLKTVLSFSIFKQSDIKIASVVQKDLSSYELGRSIAAALNSKRAKLLILFSTGLTIDANQLLKGVQFVCPHLPVAGGISGNNYINKQGFIFCNDGVTDCGVVGVVLEGEQLSINQYYHFCWIPIGKEMTITKADGLRVYTIDHIPAYQIYRKYLGADGKSSMIINSIFPLIANRYGIDIARVPMFINNDDSIDFSADMVEGEKVRFSCGHVEMIIKTIDKLIQKIKERRVESIFVYSCVLRRGFLQESAEIETLPLQKIAPTAGFFTGGEFYHINNTNQLLNATMTTLVLSEADQHEEVLIQKPEESFIQENTDVGVSTIRDNVESRSIVILKALTNLANTVTKELIDRTNELEKVNKETLYASTHDPLTGLYNRGFYEQEIEHLKSDNVPLSIIICDVDGLKLINDTLGHSAGDTILKATADILKTLFGHDNLVARIGGDEFSVLIQSSSLSNVKRTSQKIHEAVAKYNSVNPPVPLSISFGYASNENSYGNTDILFKEADNNMYREKLHQSKSIRSNLVQTLIQTLHARDIITENHSNRLLDLITRFSEYIGFPQSNIPDLQLFARFHDIGKVGIADNILLKEGALTQKERIEMQRHSEIGYRIARSSEDLLPLADWILKHHEWWNGKGYPVGLSGEDIPYECRILAIIDSYDAMTNDRPYRRAMSNEAAIKELKRCAGTQFDPTLVEKFIASMESKN